MIPSATTPVVGVWKKRGTSIELRGVGIGDGLGAVFAIGRSVFVGELENRNQISGLFDVDELPCASALDCPDPTELDFLEVGEGLFGGFPMT